MTIIRKSNCSTCTNSECAINKDHIDSEGFKLVADSFPTFAQREQVRLRGCLSHPGAREYLMAPVIKELAEQPYNIMISRDEVISLLKGVKE